MKYTLLLATALLISACTTSSIHPTSHKGLGFKGRIPASTGENSRLIPFPSGSIDPTSYTAPKNLGEQYRSQAYLSAKDRGLNSMEDCFSGEGDGYYTLCFIAQAEKALRKLPKQHPFQKISAEEYAAIAWFADFGYQAYNSALWSQDPQELTESENAIKLTLSGLNKLPGEKRTVVRCDISDSADSLTAREIQDVANRYQENTPVLIKGFWSTSKGTHPDYVSQWIEPCHVQLKIQLNGAGADISQFASRRHEQEILVRPMTKFQVIKKTASLKKGKPFYEIELIQH